MIGCCTFLGESRLLRGTSKMREGDQGDDLSVLVTLVKDVSKYAMSLAIQGQDV